jgi:hypothetical protein
MAGSSLGPNESRGLSPSALPPWSLKHYILNHFCLAVLLLIVSHYIMIFFVEASRSVMNLVFMAIVFPFGYDNCYRLRSGFGMSLVFGLSIGVTAVIGMSTILWLTLNEPFFGSPRARQDLIEATVAIMLSYGCASALARFIYQLVPSSARDNVTLATTLQTILSSFGPSKGAETVKYIKTVETIIRALGVLVVAVGALLFAIKGLFR